ncbi:MAG TPA: hypothetical protein DD381_02815 [Lentisphaeria bacterium]|nr:MAG: hypothetical protein A2X47_03440 [Lentisphaerae bacterium GWF2_38_69]HBM15266.1 hypothetical protein [Lentisphaeria bacterium]
MIRKLIKISIISLAIILFAILIFAAAIYLEYRSITIENPAPAFVKSQILPSDEAPLGDVMRAVFTFKSPWNKSPVSAEIKAADGSQAIGKIEFEKIENSWGSSTWNAIVKVQPFTTGLIPEGTAKIIFSPDKDGKRDFLDLKIPEITSLEIKDVPGQPVLASKEEITAITQSKVFYYIIGAFLVIIIALFLWVIFRKKKTLPRILTPWEKAILTLNGIKIEFTKGELQPVKCFLKLTDSVRFYLEERFYLHAPKQTTEEFMTDMENPLSPLNNRDRNFLREFMRSGDMIKFAKYDADKVLIENSIDRALLLITETIPKPEDNKTETPKT